MFSVSCANQRHSILIWSAIHSGSTQNGWQLNGTYSLEQIDPSLEIGVKTNSDGNELVVVGWELANTQADQSPVVWHYQLTDLVNVPGSNAVQLEVIASLRYKPNTAAHARLRFDTDDSLKILALGWQSELQSHAELTTYQFSPNGIWHAALEAPEAISTIAKQNFVQSLQLSGDGSLLAISLEEKLPLSSDLPINQLISFF